MKKWLILALAAVGLVFYFFYYTPSAAAASKKIIGYAWSSNIGWIKMDEGASPVMIDETSRKLSGFAWSSSIGWIRFDPVADEGYPAITGTSPEPAELNTNASPFKLVGWARACSVFVSGCSGALKDPTLRGGWDGWISLAGTNYAVTYDSNTTNNPSKKFTPCNATTKSCAWGSDVLGWIDFGQAGFDPNENLNLLFGFAQPDFKLAYSGPLRLNFVTDTEQTSNQIEISVVPLNDFTGTVSGYNVTNDVSGYIIPKPVTATIDTSATPVKLKIKVGKVPSGTYYIKVKASSGSITSTVDVPVIVKTVTRGIKEI